MPRYKCQWKHDDSKPMGCSKSSSEREFYSNTILPQETRKALNRQPIFMPKTTGERRRTTAHTHTHTHTQLAEGKKSKHQSRNSWKRKEINYSKY